MQKQVPSQSPLFAKTYDFLLWLLPLTIKFPKSQRFLLAERLSKLGLDFYEEIIEAVTNPQNAEMMLAQADRNLEKIRLYLRLSFDLQCMSMGQFEHASRCVAELGRLLGGWKKKIQQTNL